MLAEDRRKQILNWIMEEGSVRLEECSKRLNTSVMTVRRDLDLLQEEGGIKRVRGGAIREKDVIAPTVQFDRRETFQHGAKTAIAHYAAKTFIEEGDIIAMEGGTTVSEMSRHFSTPGITVLTNGLTIVNRASAQLGSITVFCCGGMLRANTMTFVGPQAEGFFDHMRANKCFVSGTGLTLEDGLAEIDFLETGIKRAIAKCAQTRILLVDSSKFGVRSLSPVLPVNGFNILVTDENAPQPMLDAFRDAGIDVHIVNTGL